MANSVAYGFIGLRHLFSERVTTIDVDVIRGAIRESTNLYNQQVNTLLAGWVERNTTHQERVVLPGSGTLQPLDEWGNPLPVAPSGFYDVGYPIQGGGTAWGTNRVSQSLITIEEANRNTLDAFQRDADWLRRHLLAAFLDNEAWTYDDKQHGSLTVRPLANNDIVTYNRVGALGSLTDTHYLAQADGISEVNNPFPTIYDELIEHPSNVGPFVVYVPTNLKEDIRNLAEFVEVDDPDVIRGVNQDELATTGNVNILGPGDEILGKTERLWVVEWKFLPDNYMIAVATGSGPVVRMREYPAANIQGLFPEFDQGDGRFLNKFIRYAGFGVRNRVSALVYQIGASSYSVPTGYDAPLAQ